MSTERDVKTGRKKMPRKSKVSKEEALKVLGDFSYTFKVTAKMIGQHILPRSTSR